nr:uncharacterized protein LOC104121342 [Nicotiana tomentosiformis]
MKAIEDIPDQLFNVKEVQRLAGRLAPLSRFISQSSKKCHRFFALLKKKNNFEWTQECRQALKKMKKYFSSPPLLSKPKEGETLLVYMAVSKVTISVVLVQEEKGETLRQAIRMVTLTNNEVEYEALIAGLEMVRGIDSKAINIKCDSQLVVNQVYEIFDTKDERMQQYVVKVQALLSRFWEWSITYIPREENAEADALANLGSSTEILGPKTGAIVQLMNSALDMKGPYQKIGEREGVNFLWENIICRFRIPKEIACDNGPQFVGVKVTKFLEDLKIKMITLSPYHPSTNGQADLTNKIIVQNLKKRLEASKGRWPEELPGVLWAYRTTVKSST